MRQRVVGLRRHVLVPLRRRASEHLLADAPGTPKVAGVGELVCEVRQRDEMPGLVADPFVGRDRLLVVPHRGLDVAARQRDVSEVEEEASRLVHGTEPGGSLEPP